MESINWLAVIVAALAATVFGGVYRFLPYIRQGFEESAKKETEKTGDPHSNSVYFINTLMLFVIALTFSVLIHRTHEPGTYDTFKHGVFHGGIIGLFFVSPVMITGGLFENRSWKFISVTTLYWVLTFMLIGGIVSAWP